MATHNKDFAMGIFVVFEDIMMLIRPATHALFLVVLSTVGFKLN